MFDFTYTEEQLALRRLVRDFVRKEVAPSVCLGGGQKI